MTMLNFDKPTAANTNHPDYLLSAARVFHPATLKVGTACPTWATAGISMALSAYFVYATSQPAPDPREICERALIEDTLSRKAARGENLNGLMTAEKELFPISDQKMKECLKRFGIAAP